jgi:hypothetical protein
VIRVVLAVLLAVALLAAAIPAMEEGRVRRTATHLDTVTDRIERAVRSLQSHEDPVREGVAARRIVRFRLPAGSWTAAGGTLHVDGAADRIGYRVDGHDPRWTAVRGADLRTPGGTIAVEGSGRHRLTVSLVRDRGVAVRVTRGRG